MKTTALLTGLVVSAGLLISAPASASVVVTIGGVPVAGNGQVSAFAPTTFNFDTTFAPFSPAANAQNVQGDLSGEYARPFGDNSHYITVGSDPTFGLSAT